MQILGAARMSDDYDAAQDARDSYDLAIAMKRLEHMGVQRVEIFSMVERDEDLHEAARCLEKTS